jgi:hypothetical protein
MAYGYRIESATLAIIESESCICQISIQYMGLFDNPRSARAKIVAIPLKTSGKLENGLLNQIESKLQK